MAKSVDSDDRLLRCIMAAYVEQRVKHLTICRVSVRPSVWDKPHEKNRLVVNMGKKAIPVLGSQSAGDASHKTGGRLPLLSARPAVTLATLKRAATSFAAW